MEQVNYISLISANIDVIGRSFTAATYGTLSTRLAPILSGLFVLYLIFWGFRFWQGRGDASIMTMVFRLIRVAIVFAIVSGWGSLQTTLYQGLTQTPVVLSSLMLENIRTAGRGGMSERTIERDLNDFYRIALIGAVRVFDREPVLQAVPDPNQPPPGEQTPPPAPPPRPEEPKATDENPLLVNLKSPVEGGVVWLSSVLFVGYAVFLIVFSKIALLVMLALAPVFIIMLLFNGPSRFFSGWLTATMQVMLVPVMLYAFLGFYLLSIRDPVVALATALGETTTLSMQNAAPFVLICFVGLFLLSQVIPLAGRIAAHTSEWAVETASKADGWWQTTTRQSGGASAVASRMRQGDNAAASAQGGLVGAPPLDDQGRTASVTRLRKNR